MQAQLSKPSHLKRICRACLAGNHADCWACGCECNREGNRDEEAERRMLEEARRYESDLRKLAEADAA